MKNFIAAALLILSANALALDACFTGSWYDPQRDGEGVNLEVNNGGKLTVAYFYTFDAGGQQVWYSMIGDEVLTLLTTVVVDDSDFVTKTKETGIAEFKPLTNNVARFRFRHLLRWLPNAQEFVICEADIDPTCEGDYIYTRITQPIPCK